MTNTIIARLSLSQADFNELLATERVTIYNLGNQIKQMQAAYERREKEHEEDIERCIKFYQSKFDELSEQLRAATAPIPIPKPPRGNARRKKRDK